MPLRALIKAIDDLPKWFRMVAIALGVLLFSIGPQPILQDWFRVYVLNQESKRDMAIQKHQLEMKLREKEYQDSVRVLVNAALVDLIIINGSEAYTTLNNLISNTESDRAAFLLVTSSKDSLSENAAAYGTFLYNIARPGEQYVNLEWNGAYVPAGFKNTFIAAMSSHNPILYPDVTQEGILQDEETQFYLQKKNIKSMISCFIGRSPSDLKFYYLLTFYHNKVIEPEDVARDIYYVRNAALHMRKLFALKQIKG